MDLQKENAIKVVVDTAITSFAEGLSVDIQMKLMT